MIKLNFVHQISLKHYTFAALFAAMFFSACENDINKIKAIAAADATKPIQTTKGVDVIFSDSAVVKFRVISPLLVQYKGKQTDSISVMPKGVKVIFLDKDLKEAGTITSDSAITRNENRFMEFRKNVVARNTEGTVYKSEQLIYDTEKKTIYSTKMVEMTKANGDIMHGTSFTSDDKLLHPIFQNATGVIHVNGDNLAQ
jgi:LPS export ABC transporter protein LptC